MDIDKCDTCLTCKMQKYVKCHGDMHKDAVVVGQGLSLDWGFMVQTSKNQERTQRLASIDRSQSSKSPPLGWLNYLLFKISPEHNNKYACMDLGSELGQNEDIKTLLIKYGYGIQPTRPDALYQNFPAE
eukprot:4485975-Ditylum_brightwellii.AAC.1